MMREMRLAVCGALVLGCSSGAGGGTAADAGPDTNFGGSGGSGGFEFGGMGGSGGVAGSGGVSTGGAAGSAGSGGDSGSDACAETCASETACGFETCACAGGVQGTVGVRCEQGCCVSKSVMCVEACTMINCGPGPGTSPGVAPFPVVDIPSATFLTLAIASPWLYFADFGNQNVGRVQVTGGSPQILVPGAQTQAIAIDATHLYWASQAGDLNRIPADGGTIQTLVNGLGSPGPAIAVDATHVYMANGSNGKLHKIPKTGGAPIVLTNTSEWAGSVALDGSFVYGTTNSAGDLYRVPSAGGTREDLGNTYPMGASHLAIGGGWVYVTSDNSLGAVHAWPLSGGPLSQVAGLQDSPSRIVTDASSVYYGQRVCGKLIRMPHGGGALSLVGQVSPASIVSLAIDQGYVYVGTNGGTIVKFPK